MSIRVIKPGLFTTVQDQGRWGYQAFGMPVAGAMDGDAYRVVNILACNAQQAAVVEMTMVGGSFFVEEDVSVAIGGADMDARLNGNLVKNWSSFVAPAGSELSFGYAKSGCRAYLAVHGGVDVPLVLGSRSTYTRGNIGGVSGRTLREGDWIAAGQDGVGEFRPSVLAERFIPSYGSNIHVRVLPGPQDDLFTQEGINSLISGEYTITDEADRMGYRMAGPVIPHKDKADIVSDGLCLGAIQVPGHGMPIVMMADRQTTGGYAKIGAVISGDLSLLAQAKPGDKVRFLLCTDEEACGVLREKRRTYQLMEEELFVPKSQRKKFTLRVNGIAYAVEIEEE